MDSNWINRLVLAFYMCKIQKRADSTNIGNDHYKHHFCLCLTGIPQLPKGTNPTGSTWLECLARKKEMQDLEEVAPIVWCVCVGGEGGWGLVNGMKTNEFGFRDIEVIHLLYLFTAALILVLVELCTTLVYSTDAFVESDNQKYHAFNRSDFRRK